MQGELKRFRYYQVMTDDGWDVGFWDGQHWYFVDLNCESSPVNVLSVVDEIEPLPANHLGSPTNAKH